MEGAKVMLVGVRYDDVGGDNDIGVDDDDN